jgi:hypothetical protein
MPMFDVECTRETCRRERPDTLVKRTTEGFESPACEACGAPTRVLAANYHRYGKNFTHANASSLAFKFNYSGE